MELQVYCHPQQKIYHVVKIVIMWSISPKDISCGKIVIMWSISSDENNNMGIVLTGNSTFQLEERYGLPCVP